MVLLSIIIPVYNEEATGGALKACKGMAIKEVPIRYIARSRKDGKKIKWSTALAMFGQIIKYRFK